MKKLSISQSLIKAWWGYRNDDQCGLQLEEKFWNRTLENNAWATESMMIGNRFEFECIGPNRRDKAAGVEPPMVMTSRGKPTAAMQRLLDMTVYYRAAKIQMQFTDVVTGARWEHDMGDYNITVEPDIIANMNHKQIVIDLKTSGMLNSRGAKFEKYGWDMENLAEKEYLTIQAIHTVTVGMLATNQIMPFYWMVFSTGAATDYAIARADVSQKRIASHIDYLEIVSKEIQAERELGFIAKPEVKRCKDCPLFDNCTESIIVPPITKVELT